MNISEEAEAAGLATASKPNPPSIGGATHENSSGRLSGDTSDRPGEIPKSNPARRLPGWEPLFLQLFVQLMLLGMEKSLAFEKADDYATYVLENYKRLGIRG